MAVGFGVFVVEEERALSRGPRWHALGTPVIPSPAAKRGGGSPGGSVG